MSKKVMRTVMSVLAIVITIVLVVAIITISGKGKNIGACIEYQCDVKNLRLSTTIEIEKENEEFAEIKGDILKFITDPLTMYDKSGNKLAYASDSYHLISQDSHSVYVNGEISIEIVGLFELLGEEYEIYDKSGKQVAYATFNALNTKGELYDMDNNLIADYNSKLLFNDFNVRITDDCELDEKTVLMLFASYYSDQAADSKQ